MSPIHQFKQLKGGIARNLHRQINRLITKSKKKAKVYFKIKLAYIMTFNNEYF